MNPTHSPPLPLECRAKNMCEHRYRLYLVACCRRAEPLLPAPGPGILDVAERYADGRAGRRALARAYAEAEALEIQTQAQLLASGPPDQRPLRLVAEHDAVRTLLHVTDEFLEPVRGNAAFNVREALAKAGIRRACEEREYQEALLFDFRGPAPLPDLEPWRTGPVIRLARSIYTRRDFAAMPALADALESCGCRQPDVLAHLRSGGPHARGCWVLDEILEGP